VLSAKEGLVSAPVVARRALLTERIAARREGDALLSWLALLGWQVELDRDEDLFVGVARHVDRENLERAVCATALTRAEVVLTLFEQALEALAATSGVDDVLDRPALVAVA
jgi:hypothetical protein